MQGYFSCSRGWGNEILYHLCFFVLQRISLVVISQMVASGELVLMYATKKVMAPSHFLYINDILIFCRGLKKNIHQVVNLFRWYGDISGQRVNWNKSQVFLLLHSYLLADCIVQVTGMRLGVLPINYLGVPLCKSELTQSFL